MKKMSQGECLATTSELLLSINAAWGSRAFPLQVDRAPKIRERWAEQLIAYDQETIKLAYDRLLAAGSEDAPSLPVFTRVCKEIVRERAMSAAADHAKRLEGQVHTAVGDYYMMMMKRQAADKGREVSYTHAKKVPLVEWEDIKAEYVRLKQAGYDVQTRTEIHEQTERMRGAIS